MTPPARAPRVAAETRPPKPAAARLVEALVAVSKARGCYKVILDCAEHNVAFYEKCGLTRKEIQMVRPRARVLGWGRGPGTRGEGCGEMEGAWRCGVGGAACDGAKRVAVGLVMLAWDAEAAPFVAAGAAPASCCLAA